MHKDEFAIYRQRIFGACVIACGEVPAPRVLYLLWLIERCEPAHRNVTIPEIDFGQAGGTGSIDRRAVFSQSLWAMSWKGV